MSEITGLADILLSVSLAVTGTEGWWDIVLSVGVFAVVVMFVIGAFGQTGQVNVSAHRQAAIATGHMDRQTVFEKPLLMPLMWLLLSVSQRIRMTKVKNWMRRTLVAAGSPEFYTPDEYFALGLLTGVALGGSFALFSLFVSGKFSFLAVVVGFVIGLGMSLLQLYLQASKRLRQITKRVPYALDLVSLAMGAGATFTEAIRTVVREKGEDPFNIELRTVLAEMDLGTTRRQALQNLANRVPVDMLRGIVSSVIQAEELGTPLAEVLHSEATLMRLQRSVRAENAAAVASVRILVPSLLILMAVVLAVFGPAIVRAAKKGLF